MSKEILIGDDDSPDVEAAPPPTDEELSKVRTLAAQQLELVADIIELQDQLDAKNSKLKQNMEVDLPTLMAQLGMTDFGLVGGARVAVKTAVNASIPKDLTVDAHGFLEEHGHGGLIKRRIQILFGREDIAWAKKFLADCAKRKKPLNLDTKEWVEPQTLSAFVREQIALATNAGADPEERVPTRLFGVFKRTYAAVEVPGAKKPAKKK